MPTGLVSQKPPFQMCEKGLDMPLLFTIVKIQLDGGCSKTADLRWIDILKRCEDIDPFWTSAPFLYSLKTSENQRFYDVFRGYKKTLPAKDELKQMSQSCSDVFFLIALFSIIFIDAEPVISNGDKVLIIFLLWNFRCVRCIDRKA